MKSARICFIALVGLFEINHFNWAQSPLDVIPGTASITYTVRYVSGELTKDAKVSTKHIDTKQETACMTDDRGSCKLLVKRGIYNIIIEKEDYKTTIYKSVRVGDGQHLRFRIELTPGNKTDVIVMEPDDFRPVSQ